MALLLGRSRRARRLVHRARCALEDATARAARGRPRPRRGVQPARPRAVPDPRAGALACSSSSSCSPPRSSARATRSRTSRRPGSTSSSGSACRLLSLLFGNVWRALSPWRALADAFVWLWERGRSRGATARPHIPSGSDATPAPSRCSRSSRSSSATPIPSNPRALAFAIALYSYIALFGMIAFGRETWTERGRGLRDPVRVHRADRPARRRRRPDSAARAADGPRRRRADPGIDRLHRGRSRLGRVRRIQPDDDLAEPARPRRGAVRPRSARERESSWSPASISEACCSRSPSSFSRSSQRAPSRGRWCSAPRSLVPEFALSLVPIALVYAVAHYFSLFVHPGAVHRAARLRPARTRLGSLRHRGRAARHRRARPEHDLVRPGGVARARPRRRPRGGARPRRLDLPGSRTMRFAASTRCSRSWSSTRSAASGCSRADERARARRHAGPDRRDLRSGCSSPGCSPVVWLRERRRRARGERPPEAAMRDEERRSRRRAAAPRPRENSAVSASPRPARALPSAATTSPARISALPSGRRRSPISATATAARVPSEFATIASTRAGNSSR